MADENRIALALAVLKAMEERVSHETAKPRPNKQTLWTLRCLEDAAKQKLADGVLASEQPQQEKRDA